MIKDVDMKRCSKCKQWKNKSEFAKDKYVKDGLTQKCKECRNAEGRQIYKRYVKLNENKDVYEEGKYKTCTKCSVIKLLSEFHKDIGKLDGLRSHCKICNTKSSKEWNKKNQKRRISMVRQWEKCNPEKMKEYNKKKYSTPTGKLNRSIRSGISRSLKGKKNGRHWEDLVGYTIKDLIRHLEFQFIDSMSWNNYGGDGWSIDHKIPISLWIYNSFEDREFRQCWSLANLQPLWAYDNSVKHNKVWGE